MHHRFLITALLGLVCAWAVDAEEAGQRDLHSFANPEHIRVQHVHLNLEVLFDRQVLQGEAILTVKRSSGDTKQPLILDTHHLRIEKVESSVDGEAYQQTRHELGPADAILGQALTIQVPEQVRTVRIRYLTRPQAGALQWLGREQTATKRQPFLFTQSQAIEARSWIPLQDSPAVRVTYSAMIRTPKQLRAVMSANNKPDQALSGEYSFEMRQAIPSYLIALAVGELEYHEIGPRTGVYAEPGVAARAAAEFADMEAMLKAAEELYGPYRWGRYDVLVLPPSFPFGGMENPRLTFASPTILAGDKSLVSLVAHELAHSWSGNLVSNATWRDFWLNEGFTVYVERRILEQVYGKNRADMEAVLGRSSLTRELANLAARDQVLHIDLKGRSPDDALTDIPYEKGALFLKHLEMTFGRERFDRFLRGYFDHFAFQSITTAQFADYLDQHLLQPNPTLRERAAVAEWLYQPGLPRVAPTFRADALARVEDQARAFAAGKITAEKLPARIWTTQEWLHFLTSMPDNLDISRLVELDKAFSLTRSQNSEIVFAWLLLAVRLRYEPAYSRLEEFLTAQGRRKFLKPLYEELVKSPEGKARALRIYRKARPAYHPLAVGTVDEIVGWSEFPVESPSEAKQRHDRVAERRNGPNVISHRGASEHAHENTLEAFRATFELGGDGNEIDIRATKDNVLVVFHDDMLDRLLEAFGDVSDYTWEELQRFEFRNPGRFGSQCRIATLIEVFELHRRHAGLLHLDIKRPGLDAGIAELLTRMDMWDHVAHCNADHGGVILQHPKLKLRRYKASLYGDRGEVFPEAIAAALKKPGDDLIVDDPRGAVIALGRRLGKLSTDPVAPRQRTPRNEAALSSEAELIATLRSADDWDRVAETAADQAAAGQRILVRARAAEQLLAIRAASPEAQAALAERVDKRSLHKDWMYHGMDGAMALRTLILLRAPNAVATARAALWRDDPALAPVVDSRWKNPRAWTDFRVKMVIWPALARCPGPATEQLCRDYLALSDDQARELGPPQFEEAAKALLAVSPKTETALELMKHRVQAVRGRAILDCLNQIEQAWAQEALTKGAPQALPFVPVRS